MQDNDPKHTSLYAHDWMEQTGLTWWKTPPESPDLNPIENLWHELKEYIRREIKPKVKQDLIDGILKFWRTVDMAKCNKYIYIYTSVTFTELYLKLLNLMAVLLVTKHILFTLVTLYHILVIILYCCTHVILNH